MHLLQNIPYYFSFLGIEYWLIFKLQMQPLRTTKGSMSVCLFVSISFFAIYSKNLQATHPATHADAPIEK